MCVCVCVCVCVSSLARLHQLLGDVVEEVPAAEGEGGLQEGQRDLPHGRVPDELKGILRAQRTIVSCRGSPRDTPSLKTPSSTPRA